MNDDQIHAAARRYREQLADTVDLEDAYEQHRRHNAARSRAGLILASVAVVALVAGAFAFRPDNGDVEVAIDEETSTTTTAPEETAVTVPDGNVPAPISLGAPDDGVESVGLPVSAEPSTGLTDGQLVSVTGADFPPGVDVGVVMCTREAGAEHGARGVEACNIGHFAQGTTDEQGSVTVDFSVRRLATLDGVEVDCASEPGRCIVAMGMLSDYDQSGGFAVDFDPSVPLPPPPAITLAEHENIADGEVVAAEVTGLVPNSYLLVQQCAGEGPAADPNFPGMRCTMTGELRADADGTFDGGIRMWRNFGTYVDPTSGRSPNVDCALEHCVLQIEAEAPGNRRLAPVAIDFDPDRGARVAPRLELAEPGPFAGGDTIELRVEDMPAGSWVDASVCSSTSAAFTGCYGYGSAEYDGSGILRVTIHADRGARTTCGGDCVLLVSTYQMTRNGGSTSGPPPLFPEPIPISITP